MGHNARKTVLLASVFGAMAWAPLAMAQGAPAAAAGASASSDAGTIEQVVITAQRRTENLQQAPVAVTALSPAEIEQRNIQTTRDLMQVTPSLQVSTETAGAGGGSATFFLRGMGQEQAARGTEPAVGIYVDDFYYPSLQGSMFNIVDVDSIEVLRGPQGTLFGRNTIGGAIRYTSTKPNFTTNGHLQGTLGSHDRADAVGVINYAFSDSAAARVTLGRLKTDGYVKQQNGGKDAGGTETQLARVQLRLVPSKSWDIELSAQQSLSLIDGFAYALPHHLLPIFPGYDDRFRSQCDYCQPGTTSREFDKIRYSNATAQIQWELSDTLTLKSLSSWQQIRNHSATDLDGTPLSVFNTDYASSLTAAYSQEFQLNGKALEDRLEWVSGLYFYKQLNKPDFSHTVIFGRASAPTENYQHLRSQAAYIDGTFKLTDKVHVIGGLRYSVDHKRADLYNAAGTEISYGAASFKSTTGRVGLQVQWEPEIMTYATLSKGFRGGGFNVSNNRLFPFAPENATTYEGGARMDLFGRRLRLNPTVFYTKWNDIQVQSVVPDPAAGVVVILQNAARAHSYGAEIEAEAAVTDKFRLFGNLSLLHIQYDAIGTANGITLNSKLQRAPSFTYTIGGRYQTEVFNGFTLRSTVNWNWQARQVSTPTLTNFLNLPSYGLLGARVELTDPHNKYTVAVFATNLTDKLYYIGGVDYGRSDRIGPEHWDLGRPREFGVSLRVGF